MVSSCQFFAAKLAKAVNWQQPSWGSNSEDLLEILCDVGAGELLFPLPWFAVDSSVRNAAGLVALANGYGGSRGNDPPVCVNQPPLSRCRILGLEVKPSQQHNRPYGTGELIGTDRGGSPRRLETADRIRDL